jgi:multiple sugar transport system substrate-binding protein
LSIVKYISPERQAAALELLKWFGKDEVQKKWAELGGYTCNTTVLQSDAFLNNTPYNKAFAESMTFVKDFWAVPVYGEMMANGQAILHEYIVADQGTAKEALDKIATSHEKSLRDAGLLK